MRTRLLVAVVCAATAGQVVLAQNIRYPDFSSTSGLTLNGDTHVVTNGASSALRLANASTFSSGSAFSNVTVNARDFWTKFSFRISDPGGIQDPWDGIPGADGLAFVVQSVSSSIGGAGGGLGYEGIGRSIAVGFDTYYNPALGDMDGNHMELDANGSVDSLAEVPIGPRLDAGVNYFGWVEYDGSRLRAWFNTADVLPASPNIDYAINIPAIIGQDTAYVGFTAATGNAWGNHDILSWEYRPSIPSPSVASSLLASAAFMASRRPRRGHGM